MHIKRIAAALLALAISMIGLSAFAANEYNMPYYIEVDITNQIVTIYKTADDSIVRQMLTSSGMNDCTPNGTFYLMEKGRLSERGEWTWFQQYRCWVKYATRIYKGYMFHSLPFEKKDESTMIQQMVDEFGLPTSHGCMRLRVDDARFIAQNCLEGTRVHIYKSESKNEELRQLLYIASFNVEDGMSYQEFLGYSEDALGNGAAGVEVSDLQHRLADLGYFEGEASGRYDTATIAAVKHVQKDLGLAQSGVTTAELQEVLYSAEAPVSAGWISLSEGRSGPVVKKLQSALQALGLYSGDLDSVYDLEVAEAVRLFQGACGYDVNGVASAEMQQALYYQIEQLETAFGEGSIPAGEMVREEVTMAALRSDDNIVIRSKPSTNGEQLGVLKDGDTMLVNAVEGDWVQITRDSTSGYVKKKYLKGYTQDNVILKFTGADGQSYTIGHTMAEYAAGAQSAAEEFAAYYASAQFSSSAVDTVDYVRVNTGSDDVKLNLRAEPSAEAAILKEVPNGVNLRVLAQENGWTRVGYEDQIGYLMNDYLDFWQGDAVGEVEGAETEEYNYAETINLDGEGETILAVVVCAQDESGVAVYAEGSDASEKLGSLPVGEQVQVLQIDSASGWVRIEYDRKQGYMQDDNLQFQLMG